MVVFKSWGKHRSNSYVVYTRSGSFLENRSFIVLIFHFRSIEYDKLRPISGVIRMETDGCGFLVEPMISLLPQVAFRSPVTELSGLQNISIVSFVSDIDWKGWYSSLPVWFSSFTCMTPSFNLGSHQLWESLFTFQRLCSLPRWRRGTALKFQSALSLAYLKRFL